MTAFQKWLDTFVEEKGIDRERVFDFTEGDVWHYMPVGAVLDFLRNEANRADQSNAKQIIVMIDFKNGDVYHFLRHLAHGLAAAYNARNAPHS
jgi:hypothetical protein